MDSFAVFIYEIDSILFSQSFISGSANAVVSWPAVSLAESRKNYENFHEILLSSQSTSTDTVCVHIL